MSDFDGEIEYLDEDAEVVQQCFLHTENVPSLLTEAHYKAPDTLDSDATNASDIDESKSTPKIVARRRITRSQTLLSESHNELNSTEVEDFQAKNVKSQNSLKSTPSSSKPNKRKRKKAEDDSDYDPREDLVQLRSMKKKKAQPMKIKLEPALTPKVAVKVGDSDSANKNDLNSREGYMNVFNDRSLKRNQLLQRNQLSIKIPDYEDPLCLPVKMLIKDSMDREKIRNWNNLCLDHLQNSDMVLKPDSGQTKCSKKIVIFRNVRNKISGKVETTIWSKTSVENERKEKKSEVFQTVLPRYRDNTVMHYNLNSRIKHRSFSNKNVVLLTREEDKDGEILVAYRPNEAISSVYKIDERTNSLSMNDGDETTSGPDEAKISLKETTNCRVCAPCYQASWRGARQYDKEIYCAICSRTFATIFNLISHLKMHTHIDVRKNIAAISKEFSKVMDYHYKCRICLKKFTSIKELRLHLLSHRGNEKFLCEIGNHVTT